MRGLVAVMIVAMGVAGAAIVALSGCPPSRPTAPPHAASADEVLGRRCRVDTDCGAPGVSCGEATIDRPGEKSCTRACGPGCPRGFECIERAYVSVVGGTTRTEVEHICAKEPPPGVLPFGAPCAERHECAPEAPLCLQSGERKLCTRLCPDGSCPAGWACNTVQQITDSSVSATRACAPVPTTAPNKRPSR